MDEILSLIAFHGITDIYKRSPYIIPLYMTTTITSIFIPMNILNTITIILTSLHFSDDGYLNESQMFLCLLFLLYYGEQKWSQNIILGYMGFIHTPLHFHDLYLTNEQYYFCLFVLVFIYHWERLLTILKQIVVSGGRQPNTLSHKVLLGIINAHILCNLPKKRFYWDSNPGLQIQSLL
jgi:hypothetical protein